MSQPGTTAAPALSPRAELFELAATLGQIFGTEDFALFLYSLVKMQRQDTMIELGTGTGMCALAMAQAAKENGAGKVLTVDDGSAWPDIQASMARAGLPHAKAASLAAYMKGLVDHFGLADVLTCAAGKLPPFPFPKGTVDLLFVDYVHRPENVIAILSAYLPQMAPSSSIFIDSASTYFPTHQLLENTVHILNSGRIPQTFTKGQSPERLADLRALVEASRFTLVHLVERKDRDQNSTAWLRIDPADVVPDPQAKMRMY